MNKPVTTYLHETPINNHDHLPLKFEVKTGDISEDLVKNIHAKRIVYIFGELDSD